MSKGDKMSPHIPRVKKLVAEFETHPDCPFVNNNNSQ